MARLFFFQFVLALLTCIPVYAEYPLIRAIRLSEIDGLRAAKRAQIENLETQVATLIRENRLAEGMPLAIQLADQYEKNGFLQEAVWLLNRVGESERAGKILKELAAILKNSQPERVWRFADSGGLGPAEEPIFLLQLPNNIFAIYKATSQRTEKPILESLAYEVDQFYAFDIVPAAYERSMLGYADGAILYFIRHGHQVFEGDPHRKSPRLRIFDFLIGNLDRGGQNPNYLLWLMETLEVAMDNGAGFETLTAAEFLEYYFSLRGRRSWDRTSALLNGELKQLAESDDLERLDRPSEKLFEKLSANLSQRKVSSMRSRLEFLKGLSSRSVRCDRYLSKAEILKARRRIHE